MDALIRVITILAFLLEAEGGNPRSCSCVLKDCYTAIQDPKDFKTSADVCRDRGGHLMTVRSTVSSDAIHDLLFNLLEDFWIGLQLPDGRCSNTSLGLLRGYEWTTGDTSTDFSNWKTNATTCSPMCVSVSSDLKWTERPCHDKIAGFMCENNYQSTCTPLRSATNESVLYSTPLGFKGEGLLALPPGSVATQIPSGIKKLCAPDTDVWLGAPWGCDIENGGCEYLCQMNDGLPECLCQLGKGPRDGVACSCAPGFEMVRGKCMDIDECSDGTCEHICTNTQGGYNCSCSKGYKQMSTDSHRCELHCPSEECTAVCDKNDPTKCSCPFGYILDQSENGSFCVDIDECVRDSKECDQQCKNTFGSFICSCDSGFDLRDGFRCVRRDSLEDSTPTTVSNDFVNSSSQDSACVVTVGALTGIVLCLQSRCL
ncbi:thrombomodulin-like [Anguilla rostrata]|uniref:thrombomodulin-like n=1 Tax=Anguilla rostrata TaxID=7938 RepID=UPI0030CC83DD